MITNKTYKYLVGTFFSALLFMSSVAGAERPLRVGVFEDRRTRAVENIVKTLEAEGMIAEVFPARRADYSKFHDYDVLFFGGGWTSFDWLPLEGRMHLVELVEQRGGGAVFSIFRCGTVARSMMRPMFPEIADGYNKVNSRGMIVVAPEHPVMEGLPERFLNPFWDHAVMRLGPRGRALALNTGGDVAIACGEAGKGRVVFMGPWIGIDIRGADMYPMHETDRQLLLNSIRWAGSSRYRDRSEFKKLSDETRFKELRQLRKLDWTHDARGITRHPGILAQARNRREQDIEHLSFTLGRYAEVTDLDPVLARKSRLLLDELAKLLVELHVNYRQAARNKELEIEGMSIEELEENPVPDNAARAALVEEWRNRLIFPHQFDPMATRVTELEERLRPELEKHNKQNFAESRAADARKVPALLKDLEDDDPATRAAAALELGRIGNSGRSTVQALISAVNDTEYNVRRNAIYALSWMQSETAAPELIKLLENHADARTRRRAAQALGQIGDKRAVPPLLSALGDSDYHVRQNAILSLGWIGDSSAAPALMDIVKACSTSEHAEILATGHTYSGRLFISEKGWDTADMTCAIRALGRIGDKQASETLRKTAEQFSEEATGGRYLPPLYVTQAVSNALALIEKGGKHKPGIGQIEETRDKSHFYWMSGRYNALYGRYTTWRSEPPDSFVMLSYAEAGGGSGIVEFHTPDNMELRQPDINAEKHLEYASELGLKFVFEMRHRGIRFDKAGMDYDIERVGHYPAFGGFWGEESLHFDETRRVLGDITVRKFRSFLESRYTPEELAGLGIADVQQANLPVPDAIYGIRPAYLQSGSRKNQKTLFAEYMDFVADLGVEEWKEAREWLNGLRKGAKLSFSLSDRYTHGGSTFISGYPRVNLALDCGGPQSYCEHSSSVNNFDLDMHVDGESRPAMGEFYAHQASTPGRVERGFASSFVYGQQFFNWWWAHIFKHAPDVNAGSLTYDEGRWEAAVRQFTKGKALSEYLAPRETKGARLVTQLYSGRTTTLTYGDGYTDSFGFRGGETVSPSGYPFRYTQNQQAFWEALLRSHLPVEMTWLETQTPEKLAGWKVAILADAVSMSAKEVEMVREWVHNGGTLIATASSTLHDQWNRKQENYSLADVFGVDYVRTEGEPSLVYVERDIRPESGISGIKMTAPEYFLHMEGATEAEYEKGIGYDIVTPTTASIMGVWEDGSPAVLENKFGKGHVIFISARYPALSHWTRDWTIRNLYRKYWPGMRELLGACVRRGVDLAGSEIPVLAENCPETVDVVLKRQDQNNRWMTHLLNIDEKNGLIQDVMLKVKPPRQVISVYYAYPEKSELAYTVTDNGVEMTIRPFDVHEMVVIEFEP